MDEKNMIPIKQEKEKKVEIVKDASAVTDSEKELDSQKEQERKERIFLIQLIVVFVVWVFLIIMVMKDEKLPPKKAPTKLPSSHKPVHHRGKPKVPPIKQTQPTPTIDKKTPTPPPVAANNIPKNEVNKVNNVKKLEEKLL